MLAWRGGFGDRTAYAAAANMKTLYFDTAQNKLIEQDQKVAKERSGDRIGPVLIRRNRR